MNEECLHGYKTKTEINQHFCESDDAMKVCSNCKFLQYECGTMTCTKGDEK